MAMAGVADGRKQPKSNSSDGFWRAWSPGCRWAARGNRSFAAACQGRSDLSHRAGSESRSLLEVNFAGEVFLAADVDGDVPRVVLRASFSRRRNPSSTAGRPPSPTPTCGRCRPHWARRPWRPGAGNRRFAVKIWVAPPNWRNLACMCGNSLPSGSQWQTLPMGSICQAPQMWCEIMQMAPVGATCWCNTWQGQLYGQIIPN
jgi:hypothetical protein